MRLLLNVSCLVAVVFSVTVYCPEVSSYTICSNGIVCEYNDRECCILTTIQTFGTEQVPDDVASFTSSAEGEPRQTKDLFDQFDYIVLIFIIIFTVCIAFIIVMNMRHCLKTDFICECACCLRHRVTYSSDRDSTGSCCPPPRYSQSSSLYRMPPPYSEVTSKPDLYPPVPIYAHNNDKIDYTVRYSKCQHSRDCTLSATSTAESLNSVCMCNAANEANSIIPPPYSFAANAETWRSSRYSLRIPILRSLSSLTNDISVRPARPQAFPEGLPSRRRMEVSPDDSVRYVGTTPTQRYRYDLEIELNDYNDMTCESLIDSCHPRLGNSPPNGSPTSVDAKPFDIDNLRRLFVTASPDSPCSSPPMPTSPTQYSVSTHCPGQPNYPKRHEYIRKVGAICKASLYMTLTNDRNGKASSSRSAPATPSVFSPNVPMTFPPRAMATSRSSRLDEESDPLLDNNQPLDDDKF